MPKWLPYALAAGAAWWFFFRKPEEDDDEGRDKSNPDTNALNAVGDMEAAGAQAADNTASAVELQSPFTPSTLRSCRPRGNAASCRELRWLWSPTQFDAGEGECARPMDAVRIPLAMPDNGSNWFGAYRSDQFQSLSGLYCTRPDVFLYLTSKDQGVAFCVHVSDAGNTVLTPESARSLRWYWNANNDSDPRNETCGGWIRNPVGVPPWDAAADLTATKIRQIETSWRYVVPVGLPPEIVGPLPAGAVDTPPLAPGVWPLANPGLAIQFQSPSSRADPLRAWRFQSPQERAAEGAGLGGDAAMGPWRAGGPARGGRRRTADEARERGLATYGSPSFEQRRF